MTTVSLASAARFMVVGLVAALPLAVSCGGGTPEGAPPPASPSTTPPSLPPAPATTAPAAGTTAAWKDLNHEQRIEFMKTTVMPKMKADFAAYDSKRFGNINCATCHGDGAKDGTFKLPNAKLPKVPNDMPGFQAMAKAQPEAMKFMATKIVPEMAQMLGEEPYDPKTGKGFGCHECHTADK